MGEYLTFKNEYEYGYSDGRASIVEELEKIKAEIDDLDRHYDNDYFSGNKEPMFKCNKVFEILDKRITKLKGENNETCYWYRWRHI